MRNYLWRIYVYILCILETNTVNERTCNINKKLKNKLLAEFITCFVTIYSVPYQSVICKRCFNCDPLNVYTQSVYAEM